MADSYIRCRNRGKMLVVPVLTLNNTHENILIFNFHRREIERFEPHGKLTEGDVESKKVDESVRKKIFDTRGIH